MVKAKSSFFVGGVTGGVNSSLPLPKNKIVKNKDFLGE
jgi:hypothetical protein